MLLISLIIGLSAAAAAATGFGFNLVSAPLLLFVYPLRVVVVLTLLLGVFASGLLLTRAEIRRGIDWRAVWPLFVSSLVGMPAGLALLLWGDARLLKVLIGGLTALFAVVMLTGVRPRPPGGRFAAVLVGGLSGVLSTSTSLNGPPVAFYLLARGLAKDQFRGTMVAFVFLATLTSIVLLAVGGAIPASVVTLTLRLLPVLAVGFAGGLILASRLSQRGFDAMVLGFLAVVGLLGIGSALR